jgi:hypothetical protein
MVLSGCQKENNKTINDFIGTYCGVCTEEDASSSYADDIIKSDAYRDRIIIRCFPNYCEPVEAIIDNYDLIIPEQKFEGIFSDYCIISGNGTLDVKNYYLKINYTRINFYHNDTDINHGIMEVYNSSKYSYSGTYKGDSVVVLISPIDDSLLVSIYFPKYWIPNGWENIKASESSCSISISVDSIKDISSGEMYTLLGNSQKRGNCLFFLINAYYHGISPLYIYRFTVIKE